MAMNIPFVGFQPVSTSEHMPAFGIFGLLQLIYADRKLSSAMGEAAKRRFYSIIFMFVILASAAVFFILIKSGHVAPWSGRFYSLWDTQYARIHLPLISSVSEHQPTGALNYFTDLHALPMVSLIGLWYLLMVSLKKLSSNYCR